MENLKHTKEYAEKLANNGFLNTEIGNRNKLIFIQGYMKAIEETAAPYMLEALIMVKENMFNCKYEDMTDNYKNKYDKITNAINKATK